VTIALSETEWETIRKGARCAGEPVSQSIREWALSGADAEISYAFCREKYEAESRREQIHLVS
jgi:hypothetical protein